MQQRFRRNFLVLLLSVMCFGLRSQCNIAIDNSPSCGGPCTGVLSVSLSAACTATPYNVLVVNSNPGCSAQSATMGVSGLTTPTVWSNPTSCSCTANYIVLVYDNIGNEVARDNGVNFLENSFIVSSNKTIPTCNTSCDGVIWGNIIGASPFTVSVLPGTVTPSIFTTNGSFSLTNLCGGTYSLNISDASGCSTTHTVDLSAPGPVQANPFTQSITCNSFSNGSFSVSPSGGTGNYNVVFSNSATFTVSAGNTAGISNLPPGPVSATVTDANNCSVTVSTVITQPSTISVVASQTNILCGGLCTGVASVAVSGGGGAYTYSWSNSPGTASSASSLCAGLHTVTITDNFNCVRTQTFNVTQPASITISPTVTNITCHGSCTGAASVTASGVAGTITFTWLAQPSGSVISTSSVISSKCAGNYSVRASAHPSCVVEFPVQITQPPAITLTAVSETVNCIGLCNGSSTANIAGGNGAPYSYTWTAATGTPGPQNGSVATGLCAGNYTLSTRDASNCAATHVFNIAQPVPFSFGITSSSVSCQGACTGVINVSPGGGTAPYNYTLVTTGNTVTSASPVFNGLCAGVYTLLVRDAGPSCPQQTTVQINEPNPLVTSVNVSSISCAGMCDGILGGSAVGGTPGYTLSWSTSTGTVAGGVLTNRCPGTYTFHVVDANACAAAPAVVTLTAPTAHSVSISVTDVSCFSDCNGVLSAGVSGGTPGYTLHWSSGFTGNPMTNLCAGNYTLTVTDANTCTTVATASVGQPQGISVTQTVSPTACAGSCDGSATLTATGGAGSYTYQFNTTPATTNTTGVVSGLCAGNYIATIRDANNCAQPVNITVTSPAALSSAITGTRNSCTSCTGAATVTASDGTAPYINYVWTNSLSATVGTGSFVNTLCPGNYTVTTTDSRSCTSTATVAITEVVIITLVSGGTGIQCFGACTGSAVASASGGQAPYTYSWSAGSQTNAAATNLCAGTHVVHVSDSNSPSCVNSRTINITEPADLVATPSQTNVSCFNTCDGAISLSVTGGTGSKSFLWSPGGMTTQSVSGLCQGVYQVTVTDGNSCAKTLSFNVAPPDPPITAVLSATGPVNCNNPNTGTVQVTPGGGTGIYTYSWFPVAGTASSITNVPAGTYSVFISSGACTQTFMTALSNPIGPGLTQLQLQNVTCFGGNNGAVSYSATGLGPFSFTWAPAQTQNTTATTSSVTSLSSGTYVIASTDAGNSCITTETLLITQPASVTANASVANIQCNGGAICDGTIKVAPSGGNAPYTYTWSPGGNNTATLANRCAGQYTLALRDNQNCASTFTFNITTPGSLSVTGTVTNVSCHGACNGSAVAQITGGTGAVSYSWLPQAGFSGSTTATVNGLCPGTYTLHATDANSCVAVHTVIITEPAALTSSITIQNINCSSSCDGAATLSATGGVLPYSYSWSSSTVTAAASTSLCAGNYTGSVVDANGCVSSKSITIASPTIFSLNLTPTQPLCSGDCNGSIQTTASGAQGAVNYVWAPAGSGQNPVNLCPATYTLIATDASSCEAQAVITLTNPPALLANVTTSNTSCNGSCNGIAVSTPANAQGAVSYTWLPAGPSSATNTGLCAGTYSVNIKDANGCAFSQTFAVNEPALLGLNVSSGPASCGSFNGSITAAPVGGTPGYTFAWMSPVLPPIATTGSVVTNLGAGIYTVSVKDANNCTNTITVPLSNSNGPLAPLTSTNVLCNQQCTGAASVGVISGGNPPYATPVWMVPAPSVTAQAIFSLCAQGYSVLLRDALGCVTFTGLTIAEPPPVNIVPAVDLPLCRGVCDGTVSLNTTGGTAPYTYTWLPGGTGGPVLNNACAGTYSVLIGYNSNACVVQETVNVVPQTSISIAPPVVDTNKCFGDCTGAATINVLSTGGGSLSLSWNNGQTGNTASSLCNGVYSVSITDQQGCNDTFSVQVSSAPQLTVSSSITQPDCGNCNGSATVTAGGGSGSTYTYNWSGGGSAATASALCAGLFQVQVTDSLGCNETVNIPVNSSNGITGANVSIADESCGGLCDGAATVTALGGTPPFKYSWIGTPSPLSGNTASGLCADTYFVVMSDAMNCTRTTSVEVNAVTDLSIATTNFPPSCGASDGTVAIQVSGGSPPYNYFWLPAAPNSATLTNIPAGSYSVTVADQNGSGCALTRVILLPDRSGPAFTAALTGVSCFGACDGAITLSSGMSPSPGYTWSTGSNNASVTGLCEGVITVTAETNGCYSIREFVIESNPRLDVQLFSRDATCFGNCNGSLAVMPTGGTLPYTFLWSPSASGLSGIDSVCAGEHTVAIADANNCSIVFTAAVNAAPQIVLTSTVENAACGSVSDGSIAVEVNGGVPDYVFSWQGPGGFAADVQDLQNILPGTYTLSLLDSLNCRADTVLRLIPTVTVVAKAGFDRTVCPGGSVVLDGSGSQGADSFNWFELPQQNAVAGTFSFVTPSLAYTRTYALHVQAIKPACFDLDTVTVHVFPEPYLDAGPSHTIPVYSSVTIGGNPTTNAALSLTWSPAFYLSDAFAENPVASNTIDITYTVSMIYGEGCIVTDTMVVELYPEIKITSGFTPNDDGRNDRWIIDYIDQFPENTVEIFNRWGERLFYSRGYAEPFDGTYNGRKLPVGTYYYVIILNHPSYQKPYTGPLTIFR